MLLDPTEALTPTECHVFGVDARRHPVLGFVVEQGHGALPERAQVELYVRQIEQTDRAAADALRRRLAAVEQPIAIVKELP